MMTIMQNLTMSKSIRKSILIKALQVKKIFQSHNLREEIDSQPQRGRHFFSPEEFAIRAIPTGRHFLHQQNLLYVHENMAGTGRVPFEVGARGTIGSLVKMEIEYFRRLDVESIETHMNSEEKSRSSWPRFRFPMICWRRKKRRNSGICSMVEVADSQGGLNEISGFSYRTLKADSKRFEV